jgi:aspartyl/asparaginyl beta-hydroxylase (cupin superfamily)
MNTAPSKSAPISLKDRFSRRKPLSCLQVQWAGVLRSEQDQLVPESSEEVRFQVANQMYLWEEGKSLVFDENWNPEAWHDTNGYRVVFHTDSKAPQTWPWLQLNHLLAKFSRS